MHSKIFKLEKPCDLEGGQFERYVAYYSVPTLDAYAVEYAELRVHQDLDGIGKTELLQGNGFELETNLVRWDNYINIFPGHEPPIYLIIHYHGVGDYNKLFPFINEDKEKERLGLFYEEAEKNQESGAWLSFMLMCGSIFEGMLYCIIRENLSEAAINRNKNFSNYIKTAYCSGYIDDKEKEIMHSVREQRNLVHLARYEKSYVSREQALNTRKVLDDMIIRFSTLSEK